MKTKICLILFFTFLSGKELFSQTGWFNPPGLTGNEFCEGMNFINENTGFIGMGNMVLKTSDGGNSWLIIYTGISTYIYALSFINENTGWASGNGGMVIKTTNGGLNWQLVHQSSAYYLWDIFFVDSQTGWLATGSVFPGIQKTTNGGLNWFYQVTISNSNNVRSVYFLNSNTGWVGCDGGTYSTTNGGINWINSTVGNGFDIFFINNLTGWSVGNHRVYKSTNGGINWSQTSLFSEETYSIYAVNKDTVFCGLNMGKIMRSTDGGFNWSTQISYSPTTQVRDLYFYNSNTGYASGDQGLILKTTTGGESITHSVSGTVRFEDNNQTVSSGKVKAIKYNYETHQIIVVDSAVIQSNGSYVLPNVPEDSTDIMAFQDDEDNAAFVPTYYSSTVFWQNSTTLYPTTNLSNININVFRNASSSAILHIGGRITGDPNLDISNLSNVYVYTKYGNQFKGYSVSGTTGMYEINKLFPGQYEMIVDRMGYYSDGRNVQLNNSSLDNVDFLLSNYLLGLDPAVELPRKFYLSQNYPNPFNPETIISFEIPQVSGRDNVTILAVFDVLGRELRILLRENLSPGKYNKVFNGADLPSGLYFYKLTSGSYSETKKMILIK